MTQLNKMDTYPFFLSKTDFAFEEGLYTPISQLNQLRRTALEGLASKIITQAKREPKQLPPLSPAVVAVNSQETPVTISILFYTAQGFRKFLQALDLPGSLWRQINTLMLPPECFRPAYYPVLEALRRKKITCLLTIPTVTKKEELQQLPIDCPHVDGFLVGTLGVLALLQPYGKPIWGNIGLNVYHPYTVQTLQQLGLQRLTLSPEQARETQEVSWMANTEVILYGKIPVMTSEHCPVGAHYGSFPCKGHRKAHYLQGTQGERYPVLCQSRGCRPDILSSKSLSFSNGEIQKLKQKGYRHFRLQILEESLQELEDLLWLMKK